MNDSSKADENLLIAERRRKLSEQREKGQAFPNDFRRNALADELHTAAKFVGDYVKDHEPDIIVLATPHGLNLSDSIGIYANHIAKGHAEWNGLWGDFRVSVNIHDDFAIEMFNHLQKKRINSNFQKVRR